MGRDMESLREGRRSSLLKGCWRRGKELDNLPSYSGEEGGANSREGGAGAVADFMGRYP